MSAGGVEYTYNVDGIRCKKTNTATGFPQQIYLDGGKILGEDTIHGQLRYFYDATGLKLIRKINNNDIKDYECVKDSQGNIVMLVCVNTGEVSCRYEYDALGKCTILWGDAYDSIVEANPFRWKGFYLDSETGFYYANGSYYDPETGLYLDAAPISTVFENANSPRHIDRNGILSYNVLDLADSPYNVFTTVELSVDPNYSPDQTWWEKIFGPIASWLGSIPNQYKIAIGIGLIVLSIALAFTFCGQVVVDFTKSALIQLALGIGVTGVGWAIFGDGNTSTLYDALSDAVFFVGISLFVQSAVCVIKYVSHVHNSSYELDPRSIELAKQGNPSQRVFRERVWKNELKFNRGAYHPKQWASMSQGKAPIVDGSPMHLHHVVGKSVDPYYVIKVTARQHIAIHKAIGYHANSPKLPWSLENAIIFGGLK